MWRILYTAYDRDFDIHGTHCMFCDIDLWKHGAFTKYGEEVSIDEESIDDEKESNGGEAEWSLKALD